MALTPLGSVDLDLENVTAVGSIEVTPEDGEIFAFDVHLIGTVVPIVTTGLGPAEELRQEVLDELEPGDTFSGGGYVLDLEAVQAVGAVSALGGLDELHPEDASFDVFLDGTVIELIYDTTGEASDARDELVEAVNEGEDDDEDEDDEDDG